MLIKQRLFRLGVVLVCCCVTPFALAVSSTSVEVNVIDPYAEMRSGPGRGYPVFHAIEAGESIWLINRRPGWYEIRTENGKKGWVSAREISRTIQQTGEPADLPTVGYGDFIEKSWWSGFSAGQFLTSELDGFDVSSLHAGYRFLTWLGAGLEYGRTYGSDISGDYYGALIAFEPFTQWRVSPQMTLGLGEFSLDSQPRQVSFNAQEVDYHFFGLGTSYYVGRRFVVKAELRHYDLSADQNDDAAVIAQLGFIVFLKI